MRFAMLMLSSVVAAVVGVSAASAEALHPEIRRFTVQPRWVFSDPVDNAQLNALVADVTAAEFRFNAAGYAGQRVRISMTIPVAIGCLRSTESLWVQWRARPTFREGRTRAGVRVVLYEGTLAADRFSEFFDWSIHLDARAMDCPFDLSPDFEIERLQ